jgi:ATP phosphoribosyltransferase regulatory subunit HisZ
VLRSDMTIPIARVVASRYPTADTPLRFCYLQHAYRAVHRHRGHPREILQAGVELVGAPGPEGTAEAISVLCATLDAAGLAGYRVGLGDARLFERALARAGVEAAPVLPLLEARDFVGLERAVPAELVRIARLRGGVEVLEGVDEAEPLRALYGLLAPDVAERVIFDLGLVRTLGYYTGAVFEVYDASFGAPLGGGGRYDELLGRFGRDLPACGWALDVERVHAARLQEGR